MNYVSACTRDLQGDSPTPGTPSVVGFACTGKLDGGTASGYRKVQGITDTGVKKGTYIFVHSVAGGLAVGNAELAEVDGRTGYFSLRSTAFIVRLEDGRQKPIQFPGDHRVDRDLVTHTAYGIWENGNGRFTIAGGSGTVLETDNGVSTGAGYLIDYDSMTGRFSHYAEFSYNNHERGDLITDFEGIYRDRQGSSGSPPHPSPRTGTTTSRSLPLSTSAATAVVVSTPGLPAGADHPQERNLQGKRLQHR